MKGIDNAATTKATRGPRSAVERRWWLRSAVAWLALVAAFSCGGSLRGQTSSGGQSGAHAGHPFPMDSSDDPGFDRQNLQMTEKRQHMMNVNRQKTMTADAYRLLKLARELNDEVAHLNGDALSEAQLKKVAEIEKLARSVKEKMALGVPGPQLVPLAPDYFPPRQ